MCDDLVGKYLRVLYSSLFPYCLSALCIWVTVIAHCSHMVYLICIYLVPYL